MENERTAPVLDWKYEKGRISCVDGEGSLIAEATYLVLSGNKADIDHTYVSPAYRGLGIAGRLMEAVCAALEKDGLAVTATCPYAAEWLEKRGGR